MLLVPVVFLAGLTPTASSHEAPTPSYEAPTSSHEAPTPPPDPFAHLPLELARELPALPASAALEPRPHPYSQRIRASFRIRVNQDLLVPYRVLALVAIPGERIFIEVDAVAPPHEGDRSVENFRLRTPDGVVPPSPGGGWSWQAPLEPGPVPLRVESAASGDAIALNVLVTHPFEDVSAGAMNGFRIGDYRPPNGDDPPGGFIEANDEVLDLLVAPGFRLRQFLPHQPGDPRYLALSEPLVLKLQAVLEEVRVEGIEAETLHVMSAFRTPHYNRSIGNRTEGSRHLWGDAADVFIDETGDGRMDDLTGDGRGGEADARILYRIAERVEVRDEPHVRPGGLGFYRANAVRGPFIHIDARGARARW